MRKSTIQRTPKMHMKDFYQVEKAIKEFQKKADIEAIEKFRKITDLSERLKNENP